ncbi:Leucine-rich repeat extensin-like protein 3, partial [Cucurbita argyrosperma subsp. argyrosperma]
MGVKSRNILRKYHSNKRWLKDTRKQVKPTVLLFSAMRNAQKLSFINKASLQVHSLSTCPISLEKSHYLKPAKHNCQLGRMQYVLLYRCGIDLNHGNITGYLPEELHLLSDMPFSTIFKSVFLSISKNNWFAGKFPRDVLNFPSHKYLGLQFNEFEVSVIVLANKFRGCLAMSSTPSEGTAMNNSI